MISAMRGQFDQQREHILANLDTSHIGKSYKVKSWLDDLENWEQADQSFAQAIQPIIYTIIVETGKDAIAGLGISTSIYDPVASAITSYFTQRATKIATDVNAETDKQLRATLAEGIKAGESSYGLRARVEAVMGSASTMRADRIARTEVSRAQGYGDVEAWKQSGVVASKEWFTAEDEHVCPFCHSLDGQVFALDENIFSKGDSLTIEGKTQHYNYDDVPANPLHVNCRCTLLPVRG